MGKNVDEAGQRERLRSWQEEQLGTTVPVGAGTGQTFAQWNETPAAERTSDPFDFSKPYQYLDDLIPYERFRAFDFSPEMRTGHPIHNGQVVLFVVAMLWLPALTLGFWLFG